MMFKREKHLDRLIAAKDTDYVKLLVGIRRNGKSSLLELMIQHLLGNGINDEQIIFEKGSKIKKSGFDI